MKKTVLPEYLFNIIPQNTHQYSTRLAEDVTIFYCKTDIIRYSYFPSTIFEWNNLDIKIGKANSLIPFKNYLLRTAGQHIAMPTYGIHNPIGLNFSPG